MPDNLTLPVVERPLVTPAAETPAPAADGGTHVAQPTAETVQDWVAERAAALLEHAGWTARVGAFADLASVDVALAGGASIVLVPMAETAWGESDAPDVDVWHGLVRDVGGGYAQYDDPDEGPDVCPSVLWAWGAGLDPSVAVLLVESALADEVMRNRFDLNA